MIRVLVIVSLAGMFPNPTKKQDRTSLSHSSRVQPIMAGKAQGGCLRQPVTLPPPRKAEVERGECWCIACFLLFMESRTPALVGFNYIHVCLLVSVNTVSSIPHRHAQWLDPIKLRVNKDQNLVLASVSNTPQMQTPKTTQQFDRFPSEEAAGLSLNSRMTREGCSLGPSSSTLPTWPPIPANFRDCPCAVLSYPGGWQDPGSLFFRLLSAWNASNDPVLRKLL